MRLVQVVDLSAPITHDGPDVPEALRTSIDFEDHAAGASAIEQMFAVRAEHLRDGEGWAVETFLRFGTHNSTHVDAPWHYNSTIDGVRAKTIDELPLSWFFAPGVLLDFAHKADGDAVTAVEMEAELARIGHELQPGDIVLVRTGRDVFYGTLEYLARGPGVDVNATRWLHARGVRVMGIDAWSWDQPLYMQAADVARTGAKGVFWAAHQADLEYAQIERLVGLDALPATGFTVSCLPLRIVGASAAPARAIALVPEPGDDVAGGVG